MVELMPKYYQGLHGAGRIEAISRCPPRESATASENGLAKS
jgi:hypothetical protein